MAENGGAYFPVRAGFCRDRAARSLRRAHGWEGVGRYVGLLCMLLEEPGNALDVSTPDGMDDLADQLGLDREGCASLLRDMAAAGMLDAGALEEGTVRAHVVDEAIRDREAFASKMREAGKKGAEARWGKRREPDG